MEFFKSGSNAITSTAVSLSANWRLLGCESGKYNAPPELEENSQDWLPAPVPGTVALALQTAGKWTLNDSADFDAKDWWYQCRFTAAPADSHEQTLLHFTGLATLVEVWLNGEPILHGDNMFLEHHLDVTRLLQDDNVLTLCFRSLQAALAERRARPRWKTKLVAQQQLRWLRTTLLGRIPGWSPPIAPVGPWRDILVETRQAWSISDISLSPTLEDDQGVVAVACRLDGLAEQTQITARLVVDNHSGALQVVKDPSGYRIAGQLRLDNPQLWWPHTHGTPALYPCKLVIETGTQNLTLDCGHVGFRRVQLNQTDAGFALSINGEPVFCRGACWTINDIVSIQGTLTELTQCLQLARDAGMNMLRVGGTMVYESEAFYRLCDQLGILVWQDFMFANMDYPVEDAAFSASVSHEVSQQLRRWQAHPCIAVYCGNSEVEQQAAMLGMPQDAWRSRLFSQVIPELCTALHPQIPYVPSTPSGGTLPFHVGQGITHYYGVGAYLRPLTDVRRANVRFTPECLGFSNVPEDETLNALFDGQLPVCHHPLWKSRVPRDTGTGWDFEDVRDHYLKTLFDKDPIALRSFDMPQYLALSRITTGEMMGQVFAEWRSAYSQCGGALIWFYKDLWPGAGWGLLDSRSRPKACFRYLQRVWQAQTLVLTDEGLDGVHVHVINEKAESLQARLELVLLRDSRVVVAKAERALTLAPRATRTFGSDELLQGFYDVSYAYRFGPPKHDTVVASLLDGEGKDLLAEAVYFAGLRKTDAQVQVNLVAQVHAQDDGDFLLALETDTLLQAVHFDIKGYYASDEYFHLVPGRRRLIRLRPRGEPLKKFRGYVESISLREAISITIA